jgi:hypothetical protein
MCFCNAAACQACSKRGNIEERNVSSFLQTTNVYLSTKNTNSLKFTLEQTIPAVVQRSTAFSSQITATTVITVERKFKLCCLYTSLCPITMISLLVHMCQLQYIFNNLLVCLYICSHVN